MPMKRHSLYGREDKAHYETGPRGYAEANLLMGRLNKAALGGFVKSDEYKRIKRIAVVMGDVEAASRELAEILEARKWK